jgi:hypothetical protein
LLNLVESYTSTLPIILSATLEAICLCWCYGTERLQENIRLMLNKDLNGYWKICFKFFTPVLAIIILIITVASNTEVQLGSYRYPWWAHLIGWFIVAVIVAPLFKFAISAMIDGGVFKVRVLSVFLLISNEILIKKILFKRIYGN